MLQPGPDVVRFGDAAGLGAAEIGGKAVGLVELAAQGLPVPDGFVITAGAFRRLAAEHGLDRALAVALGRLDPADGPALDAAAARARELVERIVPPPELAGAVEAAYGRLAAASGQAAPAVAVRSSAAGEDSAAASFAGEFESYLGVVGAASVLDHLRRCWAAAFGARGLAYALRRGRSPLELEMAVVVQAMVPAVASGVLFTLDPVSGDRMRLVVEGSWGLGLAVVGGEVTPDRWLLDKATLAIVAATTATKRREYRLGPDGGVAAVEVAAARREAPCLRDDQVVALATLGKRAERAERRPLDLEWATTADGAVVLLQKRPVTALAEGRSSEVFAAEGSALGWVTSALTRGVRAR